MSFWEGDLHARVAELERENARLREVECPCHGGRGYTSCVAFGHADDVTRELAERQMHELARLVVEESIPEYERIEDGRVRRIEALESLARDLYLQLLNAYDAKELDGFQERMRELGMDPYDTGEEGS